MMKNKIMWNYVYRMFNEKYWGGKLRSIPVFSKRLTKDKLAEFQFTPQGFDSILISTNQGLSTREAMGVLLHEMCHVSVLKDYGPDVEPHGKEWQNEMKRIGFLGNVDAYTDGVEYFTKSACKSILAEYIILIDTEEYGLE